MSFTIPSASALIALLATAATATATERAAGVHGGDCPGPAWHQRCIVYPLDGERHAEDRLGVAPSLPERDRYLEVVKEELALLAPAPSVLVGTAPAAEMPAGRLTVAVRGRVDHRVVAAVLRAAVMDRRAEHLCLEIDLRRPFFAACDLVVGDAADPSHPVLPAELLEKLCDPEISAKDFWRAAAGQARRDGVTAEALAARHRGLDTAPPPVPPDNQDNQPPPPPPPPPPTDEPPFTQAGEGGRVGVDEF